MILFPTLVYRCPGPNPGSLGTTYASLGCADQAAFDAAVADGWYATMPQAIKAFLRPSEAAAEPVADDAPPTRGEMLEQAERIGLKVDKRWSDARLYERILEHMKAAA